MSPREPLFRRLAVLLVWAVLLLPPLFFLPSAKDAFRLPKLMVSQWLALASVTLLAVGLLRLRNLDPAAFLRRGVVRAVLPYLAVATVSWFLAEHRLQVRSGTIDLWIGAVALVGWSIAFSQRRLRLWLDGWLLPAVLLGLAALLQFHDLFRALEFEGGDEARRLGITSLAGNPGDLGAYLVLPCLMALHALLAGRRRRALWGCGLALCLYGLVVSQALVAIAALGIGVAVLLWGMLDRRRALLAYGGGVVLVALAAAVAIPSSERLRGKAEDLAQGRLNQLLTGRLDGWHGALWMWRQHPLTGVGHGAFRAEYITAKQALAAEGMEFYEDQKQPVFANAHNEYLELAAESGLLGLVAVGFFLWVLGRRLRLLWMRDRGEGALAVAGTAALAVAALGGFPLRIALVGFPAILFLAWTFAATESESAVAEPIDGERRRRGLAWGVIAVLMLGLALHTGRLFRRLGASQELQRAEALAVELAQMRAAGRPLLRENLRRLEGVEAADRLEVGIPIAIGGHHLLLGDPAEAEAAYRRALAIEPRPEIYLNLGRARLMAGDREGARAHFETAVLLDPKLARLIPLRDLR